MEQFIKQGVTSLPTSIYLEKNQAKELVLSKHKHFHDFSKYNAV